GAAVGGPLRKDRTFFFVGYEGLREDLGRTISTVVPDANARLGIIPDPAGGGGTITVPVSPAVRPYLDAFPLPNGANLGGGLAAFSFPFQQKLDQDLFQARVDQNVSGRGQLFVRYTYDRADLRLPTDFPQFPRTFVSRNQFATGEYRHVISGSSMASARLGWSRTRVGQEVEANLAGVAPFVPGRELMGDIDIGGVPRFGPQSSVNVDLRQDVWSLAGDFTHGSGRHLLKAGALVERYRDREFNPTFSLGIFTFPNLETFLRNRPQRFIGLTPEGDLARQWNFTLLGLYAQDEVRLGRHLTVTAGLRYEYATLPEEAQGRDVNLQDLSAPAVTVGPLYENPGGNLSPRVGFAWDVTGEGRTAVRGGYGLYYNTNNQQNLIVTITNPPFTPRPVIANPTFPTPDFGRAGALSIRPVQYDLDTPRVHVWNVNVQRALPARTVLTLGYAGARGQHLLRNTDANTAVPVAQPDGTLVYPAGAPRRNRAFSAIELKTSDGRSWYDALIVELRRSSARGLGFQAAYTRARTEDTTQASTFFSDATNGTVSFFPEEQDPDYNRGRADFSARHNLVANLTWALPLARESSGLAKALLGDWRVSVIGQYKSGPALTAFVQANRSRSQWSPSQGPGIGFDRPDLAPGRSPDDAVTGDPNQWFDPTAFVLQPAGRLGNHQRGSLTGPDLMVVDAALVKRVPFERLGPAGAVELRVEAFNLFNRVNYGIPSLVAFAGQRDGEAPLTTFGRIRSTTTPARQVQIGLRVVF
ncbi:MAG TPA: TonB-dependent receptor, partial [Vicinamibacteria bacterium]|nr:TonB-dependent receptor [Vicinamibacteria bacterium]